MNKYIICERIKAEIERTEKTPQEYKKRVNVLQKKLRI